MSNYFDDNLYINTIVNNENNNNNEENNNSQNITTDMNTLEICGYLNKKSFYHYENIELYVHQPNPYNLNKKINMVVYDKEYNELFSHNNITGQVQSWTNNSFAEGCNWTSIYEFQMPQNYKSDIYFIKLYDVMEPEEESTWPSNWDEVKTYKIAFILKDENNNADICILSNTNTWEAYNDWAGFDGRIGLYQWNNLHENNNINNYKIYELNSHKSSTVNFHRPNYWINQEIHEISVPHLREQIYGELHTYHTSHLLIGEIYLLKWLDSINYSYNIISDCDLDQDMNILSGYKMLMLNCHSEYWTLNMYKNVLNYSSVGGNIISLSGNTMYWYSEISNNKLEVRKDNSNHTLLTNGIGGLWKNISNDITSLPLPNLLIGSEYHTESFSYGEGWPYKIIDAKKNLDTNTSWIFDNVDGLIIGQDSFNTHPDNTLFGASGWEVDRCVIGEEFIIAKAESTDPVYTNDIIYFVNNYNSKIFNTGSIRYTGALQKEVQIDIITKNVIDRFLEDTDEKLIIERSNEWFSNNPIFTGSTLKYILDSLEDKSYEEMQEIITNTLSVEYNNLSNYEQYQINLIINYKLNDENMATNGTLLSGYYKLCPKIEEGSDVLSWYKVDNNILVETTDDENCIFYISGDYYNFTIRFNSENGKFVNFYETDNGNYSLNLISYYDLIHHIKTTYGLITINNTDFETATDINNLKLNEIFRTKINAYRYEHDGTWLNAWHIDTINNYGYPILLSENPTENCEITLKNISHSNLKFILNEFDGKTYNEMNILINNSLNEYYNILNNNDKNYVDLFINLKLNDENIVNEQNIINGNYKLAVKTNEGEQPNQWYKINENNELETTNIENESSNFYLVGYLNNFTIRFESSLGKYLSFFQKDNGDYSLKLLSYYELANNNISKFGFNPKEGTDFPNWSTTIFPTNFRVQLKHFLYDYNLNWVSAWFIDSSLTYPNLLSENENNNCELTLINLNNLNLESILNELENKSYTEMNELINNLLNNSYLNLNNEEKSKVNLILSEKQNDENLSQTGNIQSGFYKIGLKTNAGETPIEWYKVNEDNELVKTSIHDENSKFYLTGNSYKFTIRHNSENGKIISLYQMDNGNTSLKLKSYNELTELNKFSFISKTGTDYENNSNLNYANILRIKINQHLYSVDNQWISGCHIDTGVNEYPLLKYNNPNNDCQITLIPYDYVNNVDNSNLLNLESILNELENKSYNEMNDLINNSLNNSYINLNNEEKSKVDLILSEKLTDESLSQTGNIQSGFYKLGVKTNAGETPIEWYKVNENNELIKTSIHDENSKFYLTGNSHKFTIRHNTENGKIVSLYQMNNNNISLKVKSYYELTDLSKFSFISKTGSDYENNSNLNYANILRIKINQHLYSVDNQWISGCHIDTGNNEYPLLKYNSPNDDCQITLIPYDYVNNVDNSNLLNLESILNEFENKSYTEMNNLINNSLNNSYINLNNEDKSKVDLILSEKLTDENLSQTGNIQSGFYKLGVKTNAGETPIEWYKVNENNELIKTSIHDENSKFYLTGNSYKFTIRHNSENGKIVSLYQMNNGNTSLKLKSYNELIDLSKFSFISKTGTDYENSSNLNYSSILRIKINQHLYSVDNQWISGCHIDTGNNDYPLLKYNSPNDNCQITLIPYENN